MFSPEVAAARPAAARGRGHERNRQGGPDRRVRRRQDRHHRELRRRLVRGVQQGADGGGVGGLPRPPHTHADRVPRRAGGRRDVPGRDLARPDAGLDRASATSGSWTRARIRTPTTRPPPRPVAPGPSTTTAPSTTPEEGAEDGGDAPEDQGGRPARGHPRARGARPARRARARDSRSGHTAAPRPRPIRAAAATAARSRPRRRARASPPGCGRDTWRLSASQKRHGRSTALVMPMRSPVTIRGARVPAARARICDRAVEQRALVEREADPEGLGELAGARAERLERAPARAARASGRSRRPARAP